MRRLLLPLVVLLSVYGSVCREVTAQKPLYNCPRATIEAYPEEEKRPVLQFLDEARALADQSLQLFVAGQVRELYATMAAFFKKEYSEEKFQEMLAALEQEEGKVVDYEYREQLLSYGPLWEIDLQNDRSIVRYAVKTTKREDGAFLEIRTKREGEAQVVMKIDMSHFSPVSPAERRYPDAPREPACPGLKGHLKFKASK